MACFVVVNRPRGAEVRKSQEICKKDENKEERREKVNKVHQLGISKYNR